MVAPPVITAIVAIISIFISVAAITVTRDQGYLMASLQKSALEHKEATEAFESISETLFDESSTIDAQLNALRQFPEMMVMKVVTQKLKGSSSEWFDEQYSFPNLDRSRKLISAFVSSSRYRFTIPENRREFKSLYNTDPIYTRSVDDLASLTTEILHLLYRLGPADTAQKKDLWRSNGFSGDISEEMLRAPLDYSNPNEVLDLRHLEKEFFRYAQLPFLCKNTEWKVIFPGAGKQVFTRANFRGAYLKEANFENATFQQCDLTDSFFLKAELQNTQTKSSNWSRAVLQETVFSNAKIEDSVFNETSFSSMDCANLSFSDCSFFASKFSTSRFSETDFKNASFSSGSFKSSIFKDCNFLKVDLEGLNIENSGFFTCEFSDGNAGGVRFSGCVLSDTNFVDLSLPYARFEKSDIADASFTRVDLRGARFFRSHLGDVDANHSEMPRSLGVKFSDARFGEILVVQLRYEYPGDYLSSELEKFQPGTLSSEIRNRLDWLANIESGAGVKRLLWEIEPTRRLESGSEIEFVEREVKSVFE